MTNNNYTYYKKCLIYNQAIHKETKLHINGCKKLLRDSNALLLRNCYHFDCAKSTSFWFIIKDEFKGMAELSRRTRNKVRHALKFFDIMPITLELMLEQGYQVYLDSFTRYRHTTDKVLTQALFNSALKASIAGREFWGVIDKRDGTLVAYSENFCKSDMCEYFIIKARTEYLSNGYYPFYGLFYRMNEYYLTKRKCRYVSDGSRSITEHSNIHSFLVSNFKFRKAYTDIQVVYVPWLKPIISLLYPLYWLVPFRRLKALLYFEAIARGKV